MCKTNVSRQTPLYIYIGMYITLKEERRKEKKNSDSMDGWTHGTRNTDKQCGIVRTYVHKCVQM